jgi:hypothetical protein
MADISVGAAVGAGFGLIGRKPLAVLLWGAIQVAFLAALIAMFGPIYFDILKQAAQQAQAGGSAPDPSAMMPRMMLMQGVGYLFNLLSLLINSVLYCAVFRAVLHPEQSAFGYLRLGAAELFLIILTVAGSIALGVGLLIAIIPVAIIIGLLVATHLVIVAVLVGVIAGLALFVGLIYVALRFSLVGPMMVEDGKFHLFESWTLTRGKAGSLFLVGLCLMGVLLAAEFAIYILLFAVGAAVLGLAAGGFGALPAFFSQPPGVILFKLSPILVILLVLGVPLAGCAMAVVSAPWARAFRDLVPASDLSDAFT